MVPLLGWWYVHIGCRYRCIWHCLAAIFCDARIVIGVVSCHVGGRGGRTGFEMGSMSPLLTSCRLHIVNIA